MENTSAPQHQTVSVQPDLLGIQSSAHNPARNSPEKKHQSSIDVLTNGATDSISLVELQSLLLRHIRDELIEALCDAHNEENLSGRHINELFRRYIQAVRDLGFLHELQSSEDSSTKDLLHLALPTDYNSGASKPTCCGVIANHPHHRYRLSLSAAFYSLAGVAMVLAPMFVMVEVPGKEATLYTAAAFIIAFTVAMVCFRHFEPRDTVSIVAAYTAVLVTFVGANTAPEISKDYQQSTALMSNGTGFRDGMAARTGL